MDVEGLTDERLPSRTAKSRGPGAPMSGVKLATMLAYRGLRRWQTEWFTEEIAYKP